MKDKKPIALLLTPVLPLPTGSGRALRAWDWLHTLAKNHRVYVVAFDEGTDRHVIPPDYPAEGVWRTADARVSAPKFLRATGLLFPFLSIWFRNLVVDWLNLPPSAPFLYELEACLTGERVQCIVVLRLYLHNIALAVSKRFPKAIMNLDLDDHESRTRFSIAGALVRMRRYREAARELSSAIQYGFIERFMLGPYRKAYLAAETDCQLLSTRLADSITCRPNRVNVPEDFPPIPATEELTLMFVGALSYPPNEEAVHFMVRRLLPEIQERLTRPWQMRVIGRHASTKLSQLMESARNVEFISDADDLEIWYATAHIILVPLRSGGGTKFKTLEGFAHRRPLVCTGHGVRGLGAVAGKHYLHAETPVAFAEAIRRLAENQELANRIAEAGWRFCREEFRVDRCR